MNEHATLDPSDASDHAMRRQRRRRRRRLPTLTYNVDVVVGTERTTENSTWRLILEQQRIDS